VAAAAARSARAASPNQAEIAAKAKFQPLALCPERLRQHFGPMASKAATSWSAATRAKCLECCAWSLTEAKACEIHSCPLWVVSRRAFGLLKAPL
jgi:hypothetical protein